METEWKNAFGGVRDGLDKLVQIVSVKKSGTK